METIELFQRFALAAGIGLLIGLERGWKQRDDAAGTRTAGIRTFALAGLLGGVFGATALALGGAGSGAGGIALGLGFAAFAALFAQFCRDENRAESTFSATTAVAGMLTFALGAYALVGDVRLAAAAGVATAVLLASREPLHGWLDSLTWQELRAALILLTMTFIALPLLPNEAIGPYGGVNPREVWLIAIILAAVSFLGYAGVKYLGAAHGVLFAAAAGGLVSSTAVMAANARRAAAGESAAELLAAGASLATAVSLVRTLILVAALNAALAPLLAPPLLAAAAVKAGAAYVLAYHRAREGEAKIEFRNPFELRSVLTFAVFLAAIVVAGRLLSERYGAAGAIAAAVTTGLADVDAIAVSLARLAPGALSIAGASIAILAAVASNSASKLAIGVVAGGGRFAAWIAAVTLFAAAAAVLAFFAAAWLIAA